MSLDINQDRKLVIDRVIFKEVYSIVTILLCQLVKKTTASSKEYDDAAHYFMNWLVADRNCEYPKTLFEESGFFLFYQIFEISIQILDFSKRARIWQKEPYSTCLKPIFRLTLGTHNSNFGYVYEISLVLTIVIDFQKEIFHTVCISKKNLHLPQFLSLKKVAKNYYQSISGAALRSIAVDKTPKKSPQQFNFT